MNFKVKISGFPDFDGKQDSWLNLRVSFEAISESADIEEILNKVLDNEDMYKDIIEYDEEYE